MSDPPASSVDSPTTDISQPKKRSTHCLVYTRDGLQPLVTEFSESLRNESKVSEASGRLRLELYKYEWNTRHRDFVSRFLHFVDKTSIDALLASNNDNNGAISSIIKAKMEEAGRRSPPNSGRYQPVLFRLQSGVQWIRAGGVAVILLMTIHDSPMADVNIIVGKEAEAGTRQPETAEDRQLAVSESLKMRAGWALLIFGPNGWDCRPPVSFLYLQWDVEFV